MTSSSSSSSSSGGETLLPNGDCGTYTAWVETGSTDGSRYNNMNDSSDSTYVTTPETYDYAFFDVATDTGSGTIDHLVVHVRVQGVSGSENSFSFGTAQDCADAESNTAQTYDYNGTIGTSWTDLTFTSATNPNGGLAWTDAQLANVVIVFQAFGTATRISEAWIEVVRD